MALPTGLPTLLGDSSGTQIFVDYLNGNDTTGTGSLANPYKTVDKAEDVVSLAGGIINLRNNGTAHQPASGEQTLLRKTATNPTTNPITVRTYPDDGGTALFKGELCLGNTSAAQYRGWRFQNLEITKLTAHQNSAGAYGLRLNGCGDVEVSGCNVHDNNQGAIHAGAADKDNDNIQIFANRLWHTGSAGTHNSNGTHDHGIYLSGISPNVNGATYIWNNLIYQCFWGFTIQIFAPATDEILVAYNTLYDTTPDSAAYAGGWVMYVEDDGGSIDNCLITSNLVVNGRQDATLREAINGAGTGSGNVIRNNLPHEINGNNWKSWTGWSNNATRDADNLSEQDPLFVDAANADFHLESGSPAIDAGEAGFLPATDFYGTSRTTADIGAVAFTEPAATGGVWFVN